MTMRLAEPITMYDPVLMTDDEYRAFLKPDPNRRPIVYIGNRGANKGVSGFRGVFPSGRHKWTAKVTFRGITHYLGTFDSAVDAARHYDAKARELHGEYAILNFPDLIERFDWAAQIGAAA